MKRTSLLLAGTVALSALSLSGGARADVITTNPDGSITVTRNGYNSGQSRYDNNRNWNNRGDHNGNNGGNGDHPGNGGGHNGNNGNHDGIVVNGPGDPRANAIRQFVQNGGYTGRGGINQGYNGNGGIPYCPPNYPGYNYPSYPNFNGYYGGYYPYYPPVYAAPPSSTVIIGNGGYYGYPNYGYNYGYSGYGYGYPYNYNYGSSYGGASITVRRGGVSATVGGGRTRGYRR